MKHFLLLIALCSYCHLSFAQCGSSSGSGSSDYYDPWENNSSSNSDKSSSSDYSSSNLGPEDYPNFLIGGGVHLGLFSNSIGKSNQNDDRNPQMSEPSELWDQNPFTGYVELMIPLNTKRLISFGLGASWHSRRSITRNHYSLPTQESITYAENPEDVSRLDWNTRSTFKAYTFLAQSDIEILNIANIFSILGRAEVGLTNYRISTNVNYTDGCGCNHSLLMSESSKVTFTGGVGLGLSIGYKAFEFRSTFGYRIYNQIGIRSINELAATESVIDEANYDYLGYPEREIFSLERPSNYEPISQRNGVFYMQVGINIRFGDRW